MWRFLVALGLLLALAGLVVVALGMAIFVSSFGNTLVATGAISFSSGIILFAVAMVLRAVSELSARLDAFIASGALPSGAPFALPAEPDLGPEPDLEDEADYEPDLPPEPEPVLEVPPARPLPPPPAFSRPSSFERPAAPPPFEPTAAIPEALRRGRVLGRTPEGEGFAARMRPSSDLPPSVPPAPEPESVPLPTERAPALPRGFAPLARRAEPAPPAAPEPSVLKSGIVGGMAYTLYSDGSIQAELPDGTLRFASLQELRDHVSRSNQPG